MEYLVQRYLIPLHQLVLPDQYSAQSKEQHRARILRFLHCFGHGSKTHEKKRPDAQTFFGAILALDGRPLQYWIGPDG